MTNSGEARLLPAVLVALGQNGGMPARLSHPPQMPEAAQRAQRAIAAPTRAIVLRFLILNPASTVNEIGEATGATAIHPALLELEKLGLVSGDITGNRNGRKVRYTVDRVALHDALDAFGRWIMADEA